MTGQGESESSIQLHFCQRCGISIPDADVDTGRAKPAPGGYVCVGCIYQARDDAITPTPSAQRAARAGAPSAATRTLASVALIYVVGVTSFLLFRELNRKPPVVELPPVATAQDITALSRKVVLVDEQTRKTLDQLRSNDGVLREDVAKLGAGLNRIQLRADDHVARAKTWHKDLVDSIVEISERTIGLDRSAKDILRQLNGLERGSADEPGDPPPPVVKDGGMEPKQDQPKNKTAKIDPEHKQQVDKFIKQMLDKRVDKQARFNAAVSLGDLMDPGSVDALVAALKKDSYDLVRRAAAYSLGILGKHAARAAPDLIRQMDDKEAYVGYMCERALGDITKAVLGATVSFHFDPTMNPKERRAVQAKWESWWAKNKMRVLPG